MFKLDVRADISRFERKLGALQRQVVPLSAAQAVNKALTSARGEAVKMLSAETGLQQKRVRDKVSLVKANRNTLRGMIDAREGKALNLIEWVTPGRRNPRSFKKGKGVVASAWGKTKTYAGSFIGSGRNSGKQLVFARTGPTRKAPLKALVGPSIRREFVKTKIIEALNRIARARFLTEFKAALRHNIRNMR